MRYSLRVKVVLEMLPVECIGSESGLKGVKYITPIWRYR